MVCDGQTTWSDREPRGKRELDSRHTRTLSISVREHKNATKTLLPGYPNTGGWQRSLGVYKVFPPRKPDIYTYKNNILLLHSQVFLCETWRIIVEIRQAQLCYSAGVQMASRSLIKLLHISWICNWMQVTTVQLRNILTVSKSVFCKSTRKLFYFCLF